MVFAGKVIGTIAAIGLAIAPVTAQANTRAGDARSTYPANLTVPLPPINDEDDDDEAMVWVYLLGGIGIITAIAIAVSGNSGGTAPTGPGNQSNGAN